MNALKSKILEKKAQGMKNTVILSLQSPAIVAVTFVFRALQRGFPLRKPPGSVAQLYRALDFGSSGWGLESLRGHKNRVRMRASFSFLFN